MSEQRRDNPPDLWGPEGTRALDDVAGVYVGPTFRKDTQNPTWWHWCTRDQSTQVPGWAAAGTGRHQLVSEEPLHLEPSLLCGDCGTHGFIREGRWISV